MSDTVIIISSALEALGFTNNNHEKHKSAHIASSTFPWGLGVKNYCTKMGQVKPPHSFLVPYPILCAGNNTKNPIPHFLFAPQPSRNACCVG